LAKESIVFFGLNSLDILVDVLMEEDKKNIHYQNKKIWIDLENSPHVLFFNPIIQELKNHGYLLLITARDYAQVYELADLYRLDYIKIGRHYGKNKLLKVIGLLIRAFKLLPILLREKPQVAFSHGSRSQLLAAKIFRINTIFAMDYEYTQPLPLIKVDLAIVPEVLPDSIIYNSWAKTVAKYNGIKEEVYVQDFEPNSDIIEEIGIDAKKVIVTIRPPSTTSHYHSQKSDNLFLATMDYVLKNNSTQIIILPRIKKQGYEIKQMWRDYFKSRKIIIPEKAIQGMNLIWHSDLVISGGGTMLREAAALEVPAYSIFGGKIGAVDRYLADSGKLILIRNIDDIFKISFVKKDYPGKIEEIQYQTLSKIVHELKVFINNDQ